MKVSIEIPNGFKNVNLTSELIIFQGCFYAIRGVLEYYQSVRCMHCAPRTVFKELSVMFANIFNKFCLNQNACVN